MVKGLADAAVNLPWLSPRAASLVALAGAPCAARWDCLRVDPGCVVLLVRHAMPPLTRLGLEPLPFALYEPDALRAAKDFLKELPAGGDVPTGFVDWQQPPVQPFYRAALRCARVAAELARHSRRCDADLAWVGGLLAPLGWLALAAVDAGATVSGLEASRSAARPFEVLWEYFGLDAAAVARRLGQRWRLPGWAVAVSGHLALPAETAVAAAEDLALFQVVQLAAAWCEARPDGLPLTGGASPSALAQKLDLAPGQVESWLQEAVLDPQPTDDSAAWKDPTTVALLPELLEAALERRRLEDEAGCELLQRRLDRLHAAWAEHDEGGGEALHRQKLTALAEFAAGAAHEINNPLAVISGQAQYLLGRETDLDRRQTLQKIIKQTQRIHHILTDVMQFARPGSPKKQPADAAGLVHDVAESLAELATKRKVQVHLPRPADPILVQADREQISRALAALLRNAIEAAPEGGWAGVRVETPRLDTVHFMVEDSGPGPNPAHRDSLFDPFFSGRDAGRGRGLGLPIAWRLARLHDGDVFWAESHPGATCFVLSLPLLPAVPPADTPVAATLAPATIPLAATG